MTTRSESTAYIVFCLTICFLFIKMGRHTKEYGERLRRARDLAKQSLDDWSDDVDHDIERMLVRLTDNSIVKHTGSAYNNEELLRVTSKMEPNTMVFEHLPDSTNTSHMVAIFRTDGKTHYCVAYTNT